jgi:predicted nucleic acid-binding Zn ribbon protein
MHTIQCSKRINADELTVSDKTVFDEIVSKAEIMTKKLGVEVASLKKEYKQ